MNSGSKISLSEKEKQLKSIAHDLNNILSSTLHSITLLKQKVSLGTEEFSLIEIIENNSNRAADILEDILEKKESGHRIINIPRIINEVLLAFSNTLPADVKIISELESDLYNTFGSRSEIYRVVMNLLVNAKEAIVNKGNIKVTLSNLDSANEQELYKNVYDGNFVKLTVEDTGCGISEEHLEKIFSDEFSTKDKDTLSGLGLSIVKKIIESTNGYIFVESELNKGTKFTLLFPEFKRKEIAKVSGKPKTILVGEDDQTLLKLLSELLESYNFNVIKSCDGEKVLEEFEKGSKIDLVIIDKKMPKLEGLDCIKILREKNIDIPFILSTGSKGEVNKKLIEELKIEKVLNKPYDFEQMLSLIEELVN